MPENDLIRETLTNASRTLLEDRNVQGHWEGELSTSALSTATAIVALGTVDDTKYQPYLKSGCQWLVENQNEDGGWGDTTKSFSNISTSLLCWSALSRFGEDSISATQKARHWIHDYVGSLSPDLIAETVKARYGKDRTFSVPILMLCAICGTLGKKGWRQVLPLPFELAAFPREWFAIMRLPVVSYALPALIAIGHARFEIAPPIRLNPIYWIRRMLWPRVSRLLTEIQPSTGGFLEAAPLTSFVTMALASSGEKNHAVVSEGCRFLVDSVRDDGSWPIDTNLSTWATTLAVKSLTIKEGKDKDSTGFDRQDQVLEWLLGQQYQEVHPFTNSPPGGWAWTDLAGGVPDADDTPGAMLALSKLQNEDTFDSCKTAAEKGSIWLLGLQNRDGGIPTFCRGWGALPFDRSSPDLTAHTLRAWHFWKPHFPAEQQGRIETGIAAGLRFLKNGQNLDGSWTPLWFGNQHRYSDEENPTYGTSMVTLALQETGQTGDLLNGGFSWLLEQQNQDGGWGSGRDSTPSTIEETALALSALAETAPEETLLDGARWLIANTKKGTEFLPSPIGFYFARLWYFEKIYPQVWTVEAFSRIKARLSH